MSDYNQNYLDVRFDDKAALLAWCERLAQSSGLTVDEVRKDLTHTVWRHEVSGGTAADAMLDVLMRLG